MAVTGTVSSFNPHKGWGFIECNGQDVFVNKRDCGGFCLAKGNRVEFGITTDEKGQQASDVKVLVPQEEAQYFGEIKSFNGSKGYGFIGCQAFEQDVFVLRSEFQGGFAPQGGLCKFKVKMDEKGPSATDLQLLGAAANQAQEMKQMMGYGGKGFGGKGFDMWGMPPFGKGKGKGKGKGPRVDPSQKVWIGGLPEGCKWKELQEHFEQVGKTKWVEVFEGKGKGTATVAYVSEDDVAQAITRLNGSTFAGATIQVDAWVKQAKEES